MLHKLSMKKTLPRDYANNHRKRSVSFQKKNVCQNVVKNNSLTISSPLFTWPFWRQIVDQFVRPSVLPSSIYLLTTCSYYSKDLTSWGEVLICRDQQTIQWCDFYYLRGCQNADHEQPIVSWNSDLHVGTFLSHAVTTFKPLSYCNKTARP